MKTTLSSQEVETLSAPLNAALVPFMRRFPGDAGARQPVHTVYGGAHLFKSDTARKLGEKARQVLDEHGVDPFTFGRAIGLDDSHAEIIWQRVTEKLQREPVEDFRVDFEDGYGNRSDDEEDGHAAIVARELAIGMRNGTLPPFSGIRIKPFTQELMRRGLRTMDIVVSTLLTETGGTLPSNFVITLPKIQLPEQVTLLADVFDAMEPRLGLAPGTLRLEFMIETTQSILSAKGESNLPQFLDAARGRAVAAHFGTYDYTASCNITAAEQRMDHPACDFARHMMQVAYAGSGLWLSDGATNVLPIGDRDTIHRAWKLHVDHIRHSLVHAYYQGWDLHPAQLPTRYAAVYSFFLSGLKPATERLRNFMEKAGQATLVGDVFDDAATGQGLLNYFIRGINSGALTEDEALATGLTLEELRSRSFVKILAGRRRQA
ncbi:MAG TPA: phosphoenolpyruvate kinase [Thermoanaerobaculia bacterium]|jgi:citrate lyase beta subunit|nr:phosphoenolpyruvate kinase [Thermoanaerobaculia bacterium]